jgi:hypothetical protein
MSRWSVAVLCLLPLAGCGLGTPADPDDTGVRWTRQRHRVLLTGDGYEATFGWRHPFGLTHFAEPGAMAPVGHADLPLADWEWLWLGEGRRPAQRRKLLEGGWVAPVPRVTQTGVRLSFRRQLRVDGRALELSVTVDAGAQEIAVRYALHNLSGRMAPRPYLMLGFPGFTDPRRVARVRLGDERRAPSLPSQTFETALRDDEAERTLLEQRWAGEDSLHARVAGTEGEQSVAVSCVPGRDVLEAIARHVLKPRYLTSHLYLRFADLLPGETHQITVRYRLMPAETASG